MINLRLSHAQVLLLLRQHVVSGFSDIKVLFLIKLSGTYTYYIPNITPLMPMQIGVSAGLAYDGTAIYMGGAELFCNYEHMAVVRLSANPTNPAAYYPCNASSPASEMVIKTATVAILNYHPSLNWKKVTADTMDPTKMYTYSTYGRVFGGGRIVTADGYTIVGEVKFHSN